jgi:hypothetical protein
MQRTQGQEEHAPPSHQDGGKGPCITPSYKGRGYKGKHGPPPMANRHQPLPKLSRYDNPVASQRVLELARGGNMARLPKPPPPARQAVGDTRPPPADLTRGNVGIPQITENPIRLFTRQEAINEYNLVAPSVLPPPGQCLPFEDMERLLRKYMPAHSNEPIEIPVYDQDMAKYMVERLNQAYTLPEKFMYEHVHGTSRYYLDINGNRPRSNNSDSDLKNLYKILPLRMIPMVGNYYKVLMQRPGKQSDAFEYMPNAKYAYRHVKRDLAHLGVEVLP